MVRFELSEGDTLATTLVLEQEEDLALMRNTIYARHGYAFKTRKYRYYFERKVDWYIPFSTDVRNTFTPIEKDNIELLKRYEKHARDYYDTFGR